jgi:hypothetical protein
MADTVADITKTSGPIVWRGTMLRFRDRDDCYLKLTRMGKHSVTIGMNSRELLDLRDLVEELIEAEGGG